MRGLIFGFSALIGLLQAVAAERAVRPNLIAIVTDDQAAWAVGAYGNREIHTPHMDGLARDGLRFTRAFANTPVCSPSRATYLTGRYPVEHGINDHLQAKLAAEGRGLKGLTWPAVLQRNGYRTGLFGKWHLGEHAQFHPTRMGFDEFTGFLGGGTSPMNPSLEVAGEAKKLKGPTPDLLTDAAIEFVKTNRSRTFALCLHFRAPHTPYAPVPPEDSAHYANLDPTVPDLPGLDIPALKKSTKAYYASVSSVDRNLGRLLRVLDEMKLADNTLVVFTSDHGYNEGRHLVSTKGNGRWIAGGVTGPARPNMWDTSITIPLLMRWPGVIAPGRTSDVMISNIDIFRTMLGAMRVPVPADATAHGVDLSPILMGRAIAGPRVVFGQYDFRNGGLAYMRMVRNERYKLVRFFHANGMDELYDLSADPGEEKNLLRAGIAGTGDAIERELAALLLAWMKSLNDPLLNDKY